MSDEEDAMQARAVAMSLALSGSGEVVDVPDQEPTPELKPRYRPPAVVSTP